MTDRSIDTVLFDVGGTLLRVQSSVGAVYASAAARAGYALEVDDIEARFRGAWKQSLVRSKSRGFTCSDEILRDEWRVIVADSLGSDIEDHHVDGIFAELYDEFSSRSAWRLAPGALEAIQGLRDRGIRLGVLSNWDSRLGPMLEALEVRDLFDFVVVSHAVGFEKPHPAIFEAAIDAAECRPERILHIGDSFEADIVPASELGLRTVWIDDRHSATNESAGGSPGVSSLVASDFTGISADAWARLLA